jgi:hypothetical protein
VHIVSPSGHAPAAAHPFVNVIARFGTDQGTPDPSTFKAKLGAVNITPLFTPIVEGGQITGMRASISPALIVVGRQRANQLRTEVRGRAGKHRVRDVDRLRFAAADVPDQAPQARALVNSDVLLPNVPLQFDATQSHDPEGDEITYQWDFGDGTTSSDPKPVHVYGAVNNDVTVTLTVSDGQADGDDYDTLVSVPKLKPGRTPGIIKLTASAPLEYGGVPPGTTLTRTFTIQNADQTPTSEVHAQLGTSDGQFSPDTTDVDLDPGQSATVTLTFAPGGVGHQWARVTLVAAASNQSIVDLLAHGYGGSAPGTGPIPTADPAFFDGAISTAALFPSGLRLEIDDSVHSCVGGNGTGDYCLTDADCSVNGGTCPATGTCIRGDRNGLSCTTGNDCPNGFGCTASLPFLPVDVCGDGAGGLVLLSDDGTFTDNSNSDVNELAVTLMHVTFDGNGNRTGANILGRITSGTTQMGCDSIAPAAGGQAYLAEYRDVTSPANCFRDAREALVARRKSNGNDNTLMTRIDAAENDDPCDDYDPSTDLKVTPDGSAVFASLPNTGLWRIRPTPLLMIGNFDDFFGIHPDGSIVVVRSADVGPNGILRVYKISPDQAATGAPNLDELVPCATFQVPNNGGRTLIDTTYAADRVAPGSSDATILVSFAAFGAQSVMSRELLVRGTVAFSSPASSDTCTPLGFINLELLDDLAF